MHSPPEKSSSVPDMQSIDETSPPAYVAAKTRRRNVNQAKRQEEVTLTQVQGMTAEIKNEMKELFDGLNVTQNVQINTVLAALTEIQQTNILVQTTITHLSEENVELKAKIQKMEMQAKNDKERIVLLENKFEDFQRTERKANVEIKNVPLKGDETKKDLHQMVFRLYKSLNVEVDRSDIADIIKTRKPKAERSTLIVELSNTFIKTDLLKAAKTYNLRNKTSKLSAKLMGLNAHPDTPIFISENLTPTASRLYFLARDFKTANNYKYCWTSYGKVYLRLDENTPIINVTNDAQIQQLVQK
ncbi:Zinc finger DNA binding protein [Operophtera brumata]|uniref:Zinc finger DNA binding protein n=1 Tax=Operophtera brumata TaxID=104452 RepID=A0A0L7KYP3_OPEBR|nr:Zinc finger DNA binding protein [Operophtera brumata]